MVRETNCSLTAFNASYTLSASNPAYNYLSRTFNYEQLIHAAAGLTTTGDQFAGGCKDPGIGTAANSLVYVGETPTGMRVGALAGYNGAVGNNQIFTVVSTVSGTLVGITTQPNPTVAGNYPTSLVTGDLNKDGTNDIVSINYGGTLVGSSYLITSSISVYGWDWDRYLHQPDNRSYERSGRTNGNLHSDSNRRLGNLGAQRNRYFLQWHDVPRHRDP
jgi:hypothetical protein